MASWRPYTYSSLSSSASRQVLPRKPPPLHQALQGYRPHSRRRLGGPLMVYLDSNSAAGTIYGLTIIIAVGTGLSMVTGYTVATLTLKAEGHRCWTQNAKRLTDRRVGHCARCRGTAPSS